MYSEARPAKKKWPLASSPSSNKAVRALPQKGDETRANTDGKTEHVNDMDRNLLNVNRLVQIKMETNIPTKTTAIRVENRVISNN